SSVLKLVHGLTWTGAITSDDGDAGMAGAAVGSLIGGLLADEHGGRVAGGGVGSSVGSGCRGRGEGEIGVLQRRRCQGESVDPVVGVLGGGPGDGSRRLGGPDGEQGAADGAAPARRRRGPGDLG